MIGNKTVVRGKILSEEKLEIHGTIEGTIECTGDVVVGKTGTVKASTPEEAVITGHSIYISGEVHGAVHAGNVFHLHQDGILVGEVSSPRIKIDDGATLQGRINMLRAK